MEWLRQQRKHAYSMAWVVLLAFILLLVHPPGVLIVLGPAQHVQTTNPKAGVHTRLIDEVEEWKIQRTLVMVREMGTSWIVEYFPWAYIEGKENTYDWSHSDMIVAHAKNQGLQVIARLGMVPAWARPDPEIRETTTTYLDEDHYRDFANFVADFVARYRGDVEHVIIWNEPNLRFEWGYRPVDPEGYVRLLQSVYPAAHGANPEVVILGGALAPTLEPEDGHAGLNDLRYLERMYEAGGAAYFDALAAHAYGLTFPPEAEPRADLLNFRRVELLRALMVRYGDAEKQIFITESGWNDHPRWIWAVRPSQRVEYTLDAYAWAKEHWPWCPVVAMWVFRTPRASHNYQDYFAFVTPDFQPRPIYQLVRETLQPEAE
ncbi:MAG: beta-galactosidase [Anaerolineae bacterium]